MIWEAFKIVDFVIIIYNYGVFYGIYIAFGALLDPILEPYGYNSNTIALVGIIFILAGVVGIFVFGFIMDKYKKFLLLFRVVGFGTTICAGAAIYVIPAGSPWPTLILVLVAGVCVLPVIPVCISFSAEVTFPLDAGMTNGLLQLSGHLIGLIIQVICAAVLAVEPVYALISFTAFAFTGAIGSLFVKENLKRTKFAESQKKGEVDDEEDED